MSTSLRRCVGCGAVLASTSRSDRLYCDDPCRARAHRRRRGLRLVDRDELDRLVAGVEPDVAEVALVSGIAVAARSDWHAAAWVLERRWPERWALDRPRDPAPGACLCGTDDRSMTDG